MKCELTEIHPATPLERLPELLTPADVRPYSTNWHDATLVASSARNQLPAGHIESLKFERCQTQAVFEKRNP